MAQEPLAAYGHHGPPPSVVLGLEDAVGGFLRPLILRKRSTRSKLPSWATVAEMIHTYTHRNELILGFMGSLAEEELHALFDMSNQYLKDWEGIDQDLRDPAVRNAVEANKESMRQIKVKSRSLLEKDMREAIARATADRMKAMT